MKLRVFTWVCGLFLCSSQAYSKGNVIVMRHGYALNNELDVFNSNPNNPNYTPMPLTELGRYQSIEAGLKLKQSLEERAWTLHSIFHSPLPRAQETAELTNAGILTKHLIPNWDLIENDFGKYEGRPCEEFPYKDYSHNHDEDIQGETMEDIQKRVRSFLTHVIAPLVQDDDVTVLIVTHGTPAYVLLKMLGSKKTHLDNAEFVMLPNVKL